MNVPFTEQASKWLIERNFKIRTNRQDMPRTVFIELTTKGILQRGRRLNEFVLSPAGRLVHEELLRGVGKEVVYEHRWHKKTARNNDAKYTKLYKHYVPGSQKGNMCTIECVYCHTREEIPVQSLFQKKICHRCVLDGRAKRKKETRRAQTAKK
jgi:hypothetical protein